MSVELKKAKEQLAARKSEDALAPLLKAWRACPDPALADVIDRVSALVSRPELKGSAKKRHEEFLAILAKKDPNIWESHRPAEGGDAGAMFKKIIKQALEIQAKNRGKAPRGREVGKRSRTADGRPSREAKVATRKRSAGRASARTTARRGRARV